MIRRCQKFPLSRCPREFLRPTSGWRCSTLYAAHGVGRLPGPPSGIAVGIANGSAIAFMSLLAGLPPGSILASAFGSAGGNPWMIPFIFLWIYEPGHWMMGALWAADLPEALTLTHVFDHPGRVLPPMMVVGVPMAVAWFLTCRPMRAAVAGYQRARPSWRRSRPGWSRADTAGEIKQ